MTAQAPAARLYTPDILALAVSLSGYPFDPAMPLSGEVRSRTCGSVLSISIAADADGAIERFGMNVRACAIGQAAAAIFAKGACGATPDRVAEALTNIEAWLAGKAARPAWPGLDAIDAAAAYPARHGAILLPWKAAQAALGKPLTAG